MKDCPVCGKSVKLPGSGSQKFVDGETITVRGISYPVHFKCAMKFRRMAEISEPISKPKEGIPGS